MKKLDLIYDFVIKEIASFDDVAKLAKDKWDNEIGSMKPSFFPQVGDVMEVYKAPKNGHTPNTHDCIKLLSKRGLFLPNVQGLIILESIDLLHEFLQNEIWVMGIDYTHHLNFRKAFGHLVPYLKKNEGGDYIYGWFPYGSRLDQDEMIFGFRRNE